MTQTCCLTIHEYQCEAIVGVYEHEQHSRQPLLVTLSGEYDCSEAVHSDDVLHAIDYDALTTTIMVFFKEHRFKLLEKAAFELKTFIMASYNFSALTVTVDKPEAISKAKRISITL